MRAYFGEFLSKWQRQRFCSTLIFGSNWTSLFFFRGHFGPEHNMRVKGAVRKENCEVVAVQDSQDGSQNYN